MQEFDVQRSARQCLATEREFGPGESFFSVLREEDGEIVREDYSAAAWEGPPEEHLGWWRCRMPGPDANRLCWAPNDVMLRFFEKLESDPRQADMRYVLALLLVRRRVLRIEDTDHDDQDRATMILSCSRNDNEYYVPIIEPPAERIGPIQDELGKMLFARAA